MFFATGSIVSFGPAAGASTASARYTSQSADVADQAETSMQPSQELVSPQVQVLRCCSSGPELQV